MPQIGPGLWKAANSFFWWREYADGRAEQEFDPITGQIQLWGNKTPEGLVAVGWLPVTPDLAQKMRACGEYGTPTASPAILTPLHPGEDPIIYKESTVWRGVKAHCLACGAVFASKGSPQECPVCGATHAWRCRQCGALIDSPHCANCNTQIPGRLINPFESHPDEWIETEYFLGIKGKFVNRFNANRLLTEH